MSYGYSMDRPYSVASATGSERAGFIRRTYAHVALAILALIAFESLLMIIPGVKETLVGMMLGTRFAWLIVIGLYMLASFVADKWAQSDTSVGLQYAGLALYTVAIGIVIFPMVCLAWFIYPQAIPMAAILTLAIFAGLTTAVFITRKDFSFLGPILAVAGWIALGFIIVSLFVNFGSPIYLVFAFIMVALISGAILYQTSAVMRHYRTHQHVAASLALFASVATMFYYILYILLMSRD